MSAPTAPGGGAPLGRAFLIAAIVACGLPALLFAVSFGDVRSAALSVTFTDGLFEDFLGPYWRTAEAVARGSAVPDPQYVYPATLATFLSLVVPAGAIGASITAALFGALGIATLVGAAVLLRPPRTAWRGPLGLGVLVGLSYPVVHGAVWGNAGLPAVGLAALGWALALRDRPLLGGGLVGVAAALKLTPLVVLAGLVVLGKRRAFSAGLLAFFVFGALAPALALGTDGARDLTRAAFENLARLREAVLAAPDATSQDLSSTLLRRLGLPRPVGYGLGAALLFAVARLARAAFRAPNAKIGGAVVLLLALPVLLVVPAWVHALAWLPLALWLAWPSAPPRGIEAARAALALLAAALSSLPLAWALPSPAAGAGSLAASGLLTLAALLALVALHLPPRRADAAHAPAPH